MKTDLEVEVEVDLRHLGKVIIFRDKQTDRTFLLYIDDLYHHYHYHTQVKPEDVPLNLRGEGVTTHTMRLTWDQPIRSKIFWCRLSYC